MKIETSDVGSGKKVWMEGSLDTNTSPDAEAHLNQLLGDGVTRLLVDVSGLEYVSSAGLRILLSTLKKLNAAGGELRLCGLNETVQEVFDISGFSTIFDIFEDASAAIDGWD